MLKLFISTYNELIQIGLFKDNNLFDKSEFETYKSHSEFIIPMIKEILERNKLNVSNLNEIIVVNGPGSFTGTRLGVTDAKMLAFTLNIPIKTLNMEMIFLIPSDSYLSGIILSSLTDNNSTLYPSFKFFKVSLP